MCRSILSSAISLLSLAPADPPSFSQASDRKSHYFLGMESQRPHDLPSPPFAKSKSPSEFIYNDKSRSTTPVSFTSPPAASKIAMPSPHTVSHGPGSIFEHLASGNAQSYEPPLFARSWVPKEPPQANHAGVDHTTDDGIPCKTDREPVSFRKPHWIGPYGPGSGVKSNDPSPTPRVVELEDQEEEHLTDPHRSNSTLHVPHRSWTDDEPISPKTKPKITGGCTSRRYKRNVPLKRVFPSPRRGLLAGTPLPGAQQTTTGSEGPQSASNSEATRLDTTTRGRASQPSNESPATNNKQTQFSTPLGSLGRWETKLSSAEDSEYSSTLSGDETLSAHESSGEANETHHDARDQSAFPPLPTSDLCATVQSLEDTCLDATKAYLRAHIANFRTRTCTKHMGRRGDLGLGEGTVAEETARVGFAANRESLFASQAPIRTKTLAARRYSPYPGPSSYQFDSDSPSRAGSTKTRPCAGWNRAARGTHSPSPPLRGPLPSSPAGGAADTTGHHQTDAKAPQPAATHASSTTTRGSSPPCLATHELDMLNLPCTDSLLSNISTICTLLWQRAQRERLSQLGAEAAALDEMRALLAAAEEVAFGVAELRSVYLGVAAPADMDDEERRALETNVRRFAGDLAGVAGAGRTVCRALGSAGGVEAIERAQAQAGYLVSVRGLPGVAQAFH